MKFIPLDGFSRLNSLLQGVEAQGCCITMRLEGYTCRHTKEERQIADKIATYQNNVQLTPPISPSPAIGAYAGFPAQDVGLPPLVLGGGGDGVGVEHLGGSFAPVGADDIDDRLVFFVTALNTVYAEDDLDFSVLGETDFTSYTEPQFRTEVQATLNSLPEQSQLAVRLFWATVEEFVGNASSGCEYYEFTNRDCDPLKESTVYSKHYFLYNRRRKVVALLVEYGESNPYRGDDGLGTTAGGCRAAAAAWESESPLYASTPDPGYDDDEQARSSGKNKQFYGYY